MALTETAKIALVCVFLAAVLGAGIGIERMGAVTGGAVGVTGMSAEGDGSNTITFEDFKAKINQKETGGREANPDLLDNSEYIDMMTNVNNDRFGPYQFSISTARGYITENIHDVNILNIIDKNGDSAYSDSEIKNSLLYSPNVNDALLKAEYDDFNKKSSGNTNVIIAGHYLGETELRNIKTDLSSINIDDLNLITPTGNKESAGEYVNSVLGRSACFLPNTQISTPSGSIKIKEIRSGDRVISFNTITNIPVVSNVLNTFSHMEHEYLIVNGKMKVTPYHVVYAKKNV